MKMDSKRELWSAAYRFYQEQCKVIDGGVPDMAEYFMGLAQEISVKSKETDTEGAEMWKGVYGMLEARARIVSEQRKQGEFR